MEPCPCGRPAQVPDVVARESICCACPHEREAQRDRDRASDALAEIEGRRPAPAATLALWHRAYPVLITGGAS